MVTQAQIRRNQRNAKHSTGLRTIEGKNRSRFNAVKHACTAKLVLLPEEKPAEFNRRTQGFFEHFLPQTLHEVGLTEEVVYCSWQLKRCRQAQWARMYVKAVTGPADEQQRLENEVTELSAELYHAPSGRPTVLPRGELPDGENSKLDRASPAISRERRPAHLVRLLEANRLGVSWLLCEWSALLAPIERGEGWDASERFRVTRLLGIHPMTACLSDHLTSMLQACQALDPTAGSLVGEVWNDVISANDLPVLENRYQRRLGNRPAMDQETAREHLIGVVRTEIERLEQKANEHQVRAELMAELGPNLAAFDLSREGLLMTRYEFAWERAMDRKSNELMRLNQERAKSGQGRSYTYLQPSEGWLQSERDEHDHWDDDDDREQRVYGELNDGDEAMAGGEMEEPASVGRGYEAGEGAIAASLRNEPNGVSRALEGTGDEAGTFLRNEPSAGLAGDSHEESDDTPPAVLRNEPKNASRAIEGTSDDIRRSLRNEPSAASEVVGSARGNGAGETVIENERGVVRSMRFDTGVTLATRGGNRVLMPGIRLRDAVRSGNGGGSGGSRRERRLRKKEAAR